MTRPSNVDVVVAVHVHVVGDGDGDEGDRTSLSGLGAILLFLLAGACRSPAPVRPWLEEEADGWSRSTAGPSAERAPTTSPSPSATTLTSTTTSMSTAASAASAAALALHVGDLEAARRWLAIARAAPDAASVADAVAGLTGELAARPAADPTTIAILLPLSGPHAAIGAELRLAIELAPAGGARRIFLDTRGETDGAAAAVDAAASAGALALLGPVGLKESQAAAVRAAALGLPIALLAPGDGADPDAGVFRLTGSPEAEARAAAAIAATLGAPTVGVLAPRDDVGIAAEDAFATAATAAGLAVTARGFYDPTASELEPDLKDFLGLDPATNPRLAAHLRRYGWRGWQSFSPDVPFALLYVPDRYDRAALVASYLPYLGVEVHSEDFLDPEYLRKKHGGRIPQVVQLLGSSAWNHPSLAVRGGAAVEGAYFLEPCPGLLGGTSGADELFERFTARTGRAPSSSAQEAHDAWLLVEQARAVAAAASTSAPRDAWIAALRGAHLDDGACTPATVGADGQIARESALLGVDAGEIVAVPY